jgi:hypothetical protein
MKTLAIFLIILSSIKSMDITVTLKVPDPSWSVKIEEVRQVGQEVWVVASLHKDSEGFAIAMITTVTDTIIVKAPPLPIKYFIIGKAWNWDNKEPYTFLKSKDNLDKKFIQGKPIFP